MEGKVGHGEYEVKPDGINVICGGASHGPDQREQEEQAVLFPGHSWGPWSVVRNLGLVVHMGSAEIVQLTRMHQFQFQREETSDTYVDHIGQIAEVALGHIHWRS